ncbi:MAG: sulfotransferase family protein [Myxococcales bacterium]|nr:sulfotransferase family protein [Myxococcales bacterium]
MSLRVIGAGPGRTGTLSLKIALEMLGFHPCYHMIELLADPSRVVHWKKAWKNQPTDWHALFAGYQATVDFPSYRHYAELAESFPEAKVILTVRDPERWWESCMETIYGVNPGLGAKLGLAGKALFSPHYRGLLQIFANVGVLWDVDFEGRFADKDFAIGKFHEHVERVKATIPTERLLVMEVKQGWAPLCAFLGVPVPELPFPHVNDRQEFLARAGKITRLEPPRGEPLPGY